MTLSFCDEDNADFALDEVLGPDPRVTEVAMRNESMIRRLNCLCMGLLEPKETADVLEAWRQGRTLQRYTWQVCLIPFCKGARSDEFVCERKA